MDEDEGRRTIVSDLLSNVERIDALAEQLRIASLHQFDLERLLRAGTAGWVGAGEVVGRRPEPGPNR